MTIPHREAACQARERLHNALDVALRYDTDTLYQAIEDACFYEIISPKLAGRMHKARENMNAIIKAKAGGNGSKTPRSDNGWRFYLDNNKKKKHEPRHAAAQARVILHAKLDKKLGYSTRNLYFAIRDAYHFSFITEETKVGLEVARINMNAIVHARSGIKITSKKTWRNYENIKPKKLGKRKKTK